MHTSSPHPLLWHISKIKRTDRPDYFHTLLTIYNYYFPKNGRKGSINNGHTQESNHINHPSHKITTKSQQSNYILKQKHTFILSYRKKKTDFICPVSLFTRIKSRLYNIFCRATTFTFLQSVTKTASDSFLQKTKQTIFPPPT